MSSYGDMLALAIGAGVSRFPRRRSCSVSSYYVSQSYMYVLYVYTWRMEFGLTRLLFNERGTPYDTQMISTSFDVSTDLLLP